MFYLYRKRLKMIKLIEEYQALGHDICFMLTCAGNYVFEHYVDGDLEFDIVGYNIESIYNIVKDYLCGLKDAK